MAKSSVVRVTVNRIKRFIIPPYGLDFNQLGESVGINTSRGSVLSHVMYSDTCLLAHIMENSRVRENAIYLCG